MPEALHPTPVSTPPKRRRGRPRKTEAPPSLTGCPPTSSLRGVGNFTPAEVGRFARIDMSRRLTSSSRSSRISITPKLGSIVQNGSAGPVRLTPSR